MSPVATDADIARWHLRAVLRTVRHQLTIVDRIRLRTGRMTVTLQRGDGGHEVLALDGRVYDVEPYHGPFSGEGGYAITARN